MKKPRLFIPKNVRQSHIVPKAYLARFENEQGELWVYAKGSEPRKSIAKKECTQRDFYELAGALVGQANRVEKALARIEDHAKPSLEKLIAGVSLSHDETVALFLYISSTFVRTRKMRASLVASTGMSMAQSLRTESGIRDTQYEFLKKTGRIVPLDEVRTASENLAKKFDDDAFCHIQAIERNTPSFARALPQKDFHVIDASEGIDFITSDAPVISYVVRNSRVFGGFGWGLPETNIAVPLTPRKILIGVPKGTNQVQQLDDVSTETLNRTVAAFADRFVYAGRKSQQIRTLVNESIASIAFGTNAYVV